MSTQIIDCQLDFGTKVMDVLEISLSRPITLKKGFYIHVIPV